MVHTCKNRVVLVVHTCKNRVVLVVHTYRNLGDFCGELLHTVEKQPTEQASVMRQPTSPLLQSAGLSHRFTQRIRMWPKMKLLLQ